MLIEFIHINISLNVLKILNLKTLLILLTMDNFYRMQAKLILENKNTAVDVSGLERIYHLIKIVLNI